MQIFTLTKDALVLGDKDEQYGYVLWASTDKGDVMFNSQTGSALEGTQITAETVVPKTSSKGKPYQRLSKVKVVDQTDLPVSETADVVITDELLRLVKENNDMLHSLIGDRADEETLEKLNG